MRIAASEVRAWLAGSALADPIWHRTPAYEHVISDGLRVAMSEYGACQAVYCSVEPWLLGQNERDRFILVVVRLLRPIRIKYQADLPEFVDQPRFGASAAETRDRLIRRGYDGAITDESNPTVLAFHDEQVRVVDPLFALTPREVAESRSRGIHNPLPRPFKE